MLLHGWDVNFYTAGVATRDRRIGSCFQLQITYWALPFSIFWTILLKYLAISDKATIRVTRSHNQGNQIGRIFGCLAIVYDRQFLKSTEIAQIFGATFYNEKKSYVYILT
jgi:hypothetical protein